MPRTEPDSFETAGTAYNSADDVLSLLATAAANYETPDPTWGFIVSFSGEQMKVKFHGYGQSLGERRRLDMMIEVAEKAIKDFVSYLKKDVRSHGGGSPKLKELKDRRDYAVSQVSLNDRWYLQYWRVFEVEEIVSYPED